MQEIEKYYAAHLSRSNKKKKRKKRKFNFFEKTLLFFSAFGTCISAYVAYLAWTTSEAQYYPIFQFNMTYEYQKNTMITLNETLEISNVGATAVRQFDSKVDTFLIVDKSIVGRGVFKFLIPINNFYNFNTKTGALRDKLAIYRYFDFTNNDPANGNDSRITELRKVLSQEKDFTITISVVHFAKIQYEDFHFKKHVEYYKIDDFSNVINLDAAEGSKYMSLYDEKSNENKLLEMSNINIGKIKKIISDSVHNE